MLVKGKKCKRCLFWSHGSCFADDTEKETRETAIRVLCLSERSYQRHDSYCGLYINQRSVERALETAQRLAIDARTQGDKRLAENCIERFLLCRSLLPLADLALIDEEVRTLRLVYDGARKEIVAPHPSALE